MSRSGGDLAAEQDMPGVAPWVTPPLPSLAPWGTPPLPSLAPRVAPPLPSLASRVAPPLPSLALLQMSLSVHVLPSPLPSLHWPQQSACPPPPDRTRQPPLPPTGPPPPHLPAPVASCRALSTCFSSSCTILVGLLPLCVAAATAGGMSAQGGASCPLLLLLGTAESPAPVAA